MGNQNGCAGTLIVIATAIITVFIGMFSNVSPSASQSVDENYPFVLAEGGIDYSFRETLNCQFVIAGNIEYQDENASDRGNQIIMVQPLATYDNRPAANVLIGTDKRFGENGWSQLLVGNYWYLVWVHDLTLDAPLSEKVLVDNLDCADKRTLALVNFRQVLPLK